MNKPPDSHDTDPQETEDWLQSLDSVLQSQGKERVRFLLGKLLEYSARQGAAFPPILNTPYVNTIPVSAQPPYPGDGALEWRIRSLVRWNAMAMVVRANKKSPGIGGHISTFASAATLYEVAFNHFLRGKDGGVSGDQVYIQGHASPGIYARAFLEGRLNLVQLENFRRELEKGGGLSSYPHPWLMPDFWEFPTVSMGLAPISAIYQARFNRYLQARGILDTSGSRVWAFLGDGETDEPESLGSLSIAAREHLDNLTFVVNCNLQRLDGPVRGNGKIIQELEAVFRGAGWNVIKVIWGTDWDALLAKDNEGLLVHRMGEAVDGQYQKYSVESGDYTRRDFFGVSPELLKMVEHLSDEEIRKLRRGGHDPEKVFAAYHAAVNHQGRPTVILAKTIKGYGLGEAGEGRNITHQQKKLNEQELKVFRDRFEIPIPDSKLGDVPFYRPDPKSPEMQYLMERRAALGGPLPLRRVRKKALEIPPLEHFQEFFEGTAERAVSTTMVFGRLLNLLLRDKKIGHRVVPIIPDEARTFGLDPLFRQVGIYSSLGQLYEPVDKNMLLYYHESKEGQVLEEGITEAGATASFTAAGVSYAVHGEPMIPIYLFYSMFGFQRTGDQFWAFGDIRGRGFLCGATEGRTTLAGEGLQHQDGHSHLLASTVPNIRAYHPAFAYEIAVIVQDGLRRMFVDQEDCFYYLTLQNENYPMPAMPEGTAEGILKGLYPLKRTAQSKDRHVHLFGSSSILREALRAQEMLEERYDVSADVWSATSYQQLRREALRVERWNRLHPEATAKIPYLRALLAEEKGPFIAAGDSIKTVSDQIAPWVPGGLVSLGTDGYGRSESREGLRRFFEVDAENIVIAALAALARDGKIEKRIVAQAIRDLGIDPERGNPLDL
ncbi:MAG: pyruvate dehydrogenase (acetyl-transferring), homodimeric type [Deltaproteobacteria bacterium]|nr:pyruvate dehydrogenase (acetyl-transferring), homodimeric type [Deltaproteobacteria bacterium]